MKRTTLILFGALFCSPTFAAEKEMTLSSSDVQGLYTALQSIGVKERICKDGANEKPCNEQLPVPPGLSLSIAKDIRALKNVIEDYQYSLRKVLGDVSGGSGWVEPKSRAEAEANLRLNELSRQPLKVTLFTFTSKELEDAKLSPSPAVLAALLPLLTE